MKEQSTCLGLLHVELAHPAEMYKSRLLLGLNDVLVTLLVVDKLPRAERRAHGRSNKQRGRLGVQQPFSLGSHAGSREVPRLAVLVGYSKVKGEAGCDAIVGQVSGQS